MQVPATSGNDINRLTSAREPLVTKGFRALYISMQMALQRFCNTQRKCQQSGGEVKIECGLWVLLQANSCFGVETNGLSSLRDNSGSLKYGE